MADNLIESQGFSINHWRVPPFILRRGECVTLRFPGGATTLQDRLVTGLRGMGSVPGLIVRAPVLFAQPAFTPSGWRKWFRDPTAFDWLKKNTELPETAIWSFLQEQQIDGRISLRSYAGTPKALMGLKAAFSRGPGVVVFSTMGLDPMGVGKSFQLVGEHLQACSAIYLAWPYFSQGKERHDCYPGSLNAIVIDEDEPSYVH